MFPRTSSWRGKSRAMLEDVVDAVLGDAAGRMSEPRGRQSRY